MANTAASNTAASACGFEARLGDLVDDTLETLNAEFKNVFLGAGYPREAINHQICVNQFVLFHVMLKNLYNDWYDHELV